MKKMPEEMWEIIQEEAENGNHEARRFLENDKGEEK